MATLIVPLDELSNNLWDSLRIDTTLIDDTFNDVYLKVEGYDGVVIEFHTRIQEDGMVLSPEHTSEVLVYNENEMPFHKRNVTQKFMDLDDTFSVCRKIVEIAG